MDDILDIINDRENQNQEIQESQSSTNNQNNQKKSEILKLQAWAGLFYVLILSPIWTILCFVWVFVTGLLSIVTLIFPPLGFLICVGTVISWRTLARIELLTATFSSNPKYFYRDTIPQITRRMELPLLTRITLNQQGPFTSPWSYFKDFCLNRYTLNCLIYFLGRKPFSMIYYFIKYLLLVVFSLPPLTPCVLPCVCKSSRIVGSAEVFYSRRWLLPGWIKDQRDPNQNQQQDMVAV